MQRGEGAREQFSPRSQLKEGRQIQICKGIKSLSTEGGIIVVHRGPNGIIVPGPPYFTELAWAAPVILRRGESSVLSFDLWQLALKPQELPTSDQGRINVARGPWQILARGPQTSPFPLFRKSIEFKDTQRY